MSDINCPYCDYEQEVCHDDGFGYEEGVSHEMMCVSCEKNFTFCTSIMFHYEPAKADCLNSGEHNLKPTNTMPRKYTKMRCTTCDFQRLCNEEEKKNLGYWD